MVVECNSIIPQPIYSIEIISQVDGGGGEDEETQFDTQDVPRMNESQTTTWGIHQVNGEDMMAW